MRIMMSDSLFSYAGGATRARLEDCRLESAGGAAAASMAACGRGGGGTDEEPLWSPSLEVVLISLTSTLSAVDSRSSTSIADDASLEDARCDDARLAKGAGAVAGRAAATARAWPQRAAPGCCTLVGGRMPRTMAGAGVSGRCAARV